MIEEFGVLEVTTGRLMGAPNAVLATLEAAQQSFQWLITEKERKAEEARREQALEDCQQTRALKETVSKEARHAHSQVEHHNYGIFRREVSEWQPISLF